MKIVQEITHFDQLYNNSWAGAKDALDIIRDAGIADAAFDFLEQYLAECFVDNPPTDTEVNDIVWFELLDLLAEVGIYKEGSNQS